MTEMEVRFIELDEFRNAMQRERERGMDFLREIVGMDWGEEGLGAIYILENSETHENIELAVRTTDREKPQLPSVSDIWQVP
jgi:NADH-quinone oxidoreductase subunit C/D